MPKGSKLPDATRRAIHMLKERGQDWEGGPIARHAAPDAGLPARALALVRVLREEGNEAKAIPMRPHPVRPRRFEPAKLNELWQTDIFAFLLKRKNRRGYLIGFIRPEPHPYGTLKASDYHGLR